MFSEVYFAAISFKHMYLFRNNVEIACHHLQRKKLLPCRISALPYQVKRQRWTEGGRVIMGQLGGPFISSNIIGPFVSCKAQNAKYKDVDES